MGALRPELAALILAAGQGTRMKSGRAKVLHELAGQPMLHHPLAAVAELGAERVVVVVGRDADEVQETFAGRARFVVQELCVRPGTAGRVALAGGLAEEFPSGASRVLTLVLVVFLVVGGAAVGLCYAAYVGLRVLRGAS